MAHVDRVKIAVRNTSMSHFVYEEALRKNHYHRHGAGAYARAYIDKAHTHIIKVGDYDINHSYSDFVEYAMANPSNPWLPNIIDAAVYYPYNQPTHRNGKPDKIAERPFIYVAMEVLTCVRPSEFDRCSMPLECPKQFVDLERRGIVKVVDQDFLQVLDILKKLNSKGHELDLHVGNVMLRGKQMVVTDPVVD